MYYTGIDLHKKTSFITSIDDHGKIVTRANLQNVEEAILAYFATLEDEAKIVNESMASWYWLYDLLTGEGFGVVIPRSLSSLIRVMPTYFKRVRSSCLVAIPSPPKWEKLCLPIH